jgi:hypothetical protein
VLSIHDIQYSEAANWNSPYTGEYVETSGIVTGVDRIGANSAFSIQDGAGAWNGIYCFWQADEAVTLGDAITLRAWVFENVGTGALGDPDRGSTTLLPGFIVAVNSTGNELPAPVELSVADVQQEQYEGVRVQTEGVVTEQASEENNGEWKISDNPGDTVRVNDRYVITAPALGTNIQVVGVLNDWGGSDNTPASWRIEPADSASVTEVVSIAGATLPRAYALRPNYPNPFNPSTTLSFELPAVSEVRIVLYDVSGREVAVLVDERFQPGRYEAIWNGRSTQGAPVSTGIYFAQMITADYTSTIKMLLVK